MRNKRTEAKRHILMERYESDGGKKRKNVHENDTDDAEAKGFKFVDVTPGKKEE